MTKSDTIEFRPILPHSDAYLYLLTASKSGEILGIWGDALDVCSFLGRLVCPFPAHSGLFCRPSGDMLPFWGTNDFLAYLYEEVALDA